MNLKKHFLAVFFGLLFGLALFGTASAQQPVITDDQVNAIAKHIYCPVCENTSLDVCPTQVCAQWRELIREKLANGESEAEIKQYFVDQYGDRVLAVPPATGLNWLIYILPPLFILSGAIILFRAFHSWKRPVADVENAGPLDADDEYVRRLEEELRRR
jgi:cytochrome c-type biogenesis protein CcmH